MLVELKMFIHSQTESEICDREVRKNIKKYCE